MYAFIPRIFVFWNFGYTDTWDGLRRLEIKLKNVEGADDVGGDGISK